MGIYDELSQLENTGPVVRARTPASQPSASVQRTPAPKTAIKADVTPAGNQHVATHAVDDVTTSSLHDVDLRRWRDTVANTETHSSALRMTAAEREAIEDLVRDLKRGHGIKTSMNELARIGLLVLAHEFRQLGASSVIARVKKT